MHHSVWTLPGIPVKFAAPRLTLQAQVQLQRAERRSELLQKREQARAERWVAGGCQGRGCTGKVSGVSPAGLRVVPMHFGSANRTCYQTYLLR